MSAERGLRAGDRIWVRVPTLPIERRFGTITSVSRDRYRVEWDIDTREGHREYSKREIAKARSRRGQLNGSGLR